MMIPRGPMVDVRPGPNVPIIRPCLYARRVNKCGLRDRQPAGSCGSKDLNICGAGAGHGFFLRVGVGLRGLVARELLSEEFEVTESSILLF